MKTFGVALPTLAFDATHVFTSMATTTPGALPPRGLDTPKRKDWRQINLALLTTTGKDHLPWLHATYLGTVPDPTALAQARQLSGLTPERITVVFEQGNASQANLDQVWAHGWSVVSPLGPAHHRDLCHPPDGLHLRGRGAVAGSPRLYGRSVRLRPPRAGGRHV